MAFIDPKNLQQGIQRELPILPNNGNPGGANNMPAAEEQQQAAPPNPFAWMEPSPAMADVDATLKQYSEYVDRMWEQINNPQDNQNYNTVIRNGRWEYQPVSDFGLPMGSNAATFPMRDLGSEMPQYVPQSAPILPGR